MAGTSQVDGWGLGNYAALAHDQAGIWRYLGNSAFGVFAFLASWNDFIAPLILLSDSDLATLPLAVTNLRGQVQGVVDYGATEAGVVVLALPCIVLFLLLQRHYVRGFMSGALKG
jgi:multiple sugar transport system permease protein